MKPLSTSVYDEFCRPSTYLNAPLSVMYPNLSRRLNINLKTNKERIFIHKRVCIIDRQLCFDLHRHLWQSFFDIGTQSRMWPVSFPQVIAVHLHHTFDF